MSNTSNNFASREVCDLIFYDFATKKPVLYMDFANTTTVGLSGESVFAYGGKGHPKRVGFNGDRGGTISFESQISTMKLYAMVSGGTLSAAAKFVKRVEKVASDGGITLDEAPVKGSAVVYAYDDDCGTPIEDVSEAETKLTATGITDDETYVVYYMVNKTEGVKSFTLKSTSFPKEVIIYGDTYARGEDGVDHAFRMVCYKALPQSNFELSFANQGDPVSFTVTFDLEADGDKNLIDFIAED